MSLKFEQAISADKLIEQEISVFDKNVLVIPNVNNIAARKLVPYHQVLVTFSSTTPGEGLLTPSNAAKEISSLYSYFADYGKIVDFNLEYMPSCFIVTYTRHENVLSLLAKSKWRSA